MESANLSFKPPATRVRVLHIDDDPLLTALVDRRLAAYGIKIDALNDERCWESQIATESYRVVLLDIDMPYRDGLQVLRDIKRYDGTIQVIMLTGIVRTHVILEALRDGAEYCFFKPLEDMESLAHAILNTSKRMDHWREAVQFARSELDRLQSKPELVPTLAT